MQTLGGSWRISVLQVRCGDMERTWGCDTARNYGTGGFPGGTSDREWWDWLRDSLGHIELTSEDGNQYVEEESTTYE